MQEASKARAVPVAVVGASALFPGSKNAACFWRNILAGEDLITDVPETHWLIEDYYDPDPQAEDKTYCKRGGFLPHVEFDPVLFGIPPTALPTTDSAQLLALIVARQVLEDAFDAQFETMNKERMSVILGVTAGQELLLQAASRLQRPQWLAGLRASGIDEDEAAQICDRIAANYVGWKESTFPGLLGNVVAGRIANRFDLGGTNCITDAACASSLSALAMGLSELYLGHSDVVITGGVDCFNDIFMYMCFSKTPALSASGDCRPFSNEADGTLMGEGLGMFALKRLDDAERDGDRIYAVINGVGSSSDGRAKSVYAPLPEGQARAITRAYEQAGFDPRTVELIEAHGTGTRAGDKAELEGLCLAFDSISAEKQWCALGSIKSQIGHTKAAAGAAGLFKIIMALHHKVLPPTIKVDKPSEKIDFEASPFYVNTEPRPWIRDGKHPRRAAMSSFGFGGSNFHVALEEYVGPARHAHRIRQSSTHLITLWATDASALVEKAHALGKEVEAWTEEAGSLLEFIARSTQKHFVADAPARLTLVAGTEQELAKKLADAARRISESPDRSFALPTGISFGTGAAAGKLAMLFPGQGSQYVNMGRAMAMAFDEARGVWDEAARLSLNLHEKVFPRPVFDDAARKVQQQELTATEWAQPSIGATSIAYLAVLNALGLVPDLVAGHSFGELTALFAAGVLSREDMLRAAERRGALMAEAARTTAGAMSAVGTSAAELRVLLEKSDADVVIANDNSPRQVVLSGPTAEIEKAEALLKSEGVASRRLPVATAFHSPVVSDSCAPFAASLEGLSFNAPRHPVFSNAAAAPYPEQGAAIRPQLAEQIGEPVRFVEMIEAMYEAGARTFLEVGPHQVLSGLVRECLADKPDVQTISVDRKGKEGIDTFLEALATLAAAGYAMDFDPLWEGYAPVIDPRTRVKSRFTVPINGANYGKLYPTDERPVPVVRPQKSPPTPAISLPAAAMGAHQRVVPVMEEPVSEKPIHPGPAPIASSPQSPSPAPSLPSTPPPQGQANLEAYAIYQKTLAETHMMYLKTVEESLTQAHQSYLRTMEATFQQMAGQPLTPTMAAPVAGCQTTGSTTQAAPILSSVPVSSAPVSSAPLNGYQTTGSTTQAAPTVSPALDLNAVLLAVVAEKTGYPVDMLSLDMALEADLGIDSIKRVEILSALQEEVPSLPELDPGKMASLSTLREIVIFLGQNAPLTGCQTTGSAAQNADVTGCQTTGSKTGTTTQNGVTERPAMDLNAVLLTVVAEKTGYPEDMLSLDMALEADLGIDSIKRVEILSALQEEVPSLPELDPGKMASLSTLREIVGFLGENAPLTGCQTTGSTAQEAVNSRPELDLNAVLLAVVAEKTGYPQDMLSLDMALEADLGIDSIKRVEILSALQEEVPSLPELDPGKMASLVTLKQICEFLLENTEGAPAQSAGTQTPTNGVHGASIAAPARDVRLPARHGLRLIAAPAVGLAILGADPVTIIGDASGVAEELATLLGNAGLDAQVCDTVPKNARQVIFLAGLDHAQGAAESQALHRRALGAARAIAGQAMTFVTVQDTGGSFGLNAFDPTRAWTAGLTGLAKTAALEWPEANVKAIDIATDGVAPRTLANRIAGELLSGGPEVEVALDKEGRRYTLRTELLPKIDGFSDEDLPVDENSVIVASGGARGVTAGCLIALARRTKSKFILLGRTPLTPEAPELQAIADEAALKRALLDAARHSGESLTPAELSRRVDKVLATREVQSTLDALHHAGAEAVYISVDVTDIKGLSGCLAPVREQWGPITGIVHAAGVLADKLIAEKTDEGFDRVFGTKVAGLEALLEATEQDPLRFIALFSSVAARTGNVGQSDYAMANEVLNKVARGRAQERGEGCVVTSLNWGPWAGGMVSPALEAHFKAQGVSLIELDAGAKAFVAELADPAQQVEVVLGEGLPSASEKLLRFHVRLRPGQDDYLEGHCIQDTPVLPVVIVLEWFMRAARAYRSDLNVRCLRDLKVLRGLKLEGFRAGEERFVVEARAQGPNGKSNLLNIELLATDGTVHYTATAELTPDIDVAAPAPTLLELNESPWSVAELYGQLLFHGPSFRVIEAVDGVSDKGSRARLSPVSAMGWNIERWQTDAAVLDGGLQLALIHGALSSGKASLPTSIGEYRDFGLGPQKMPVECVLTTRQTSRHKVVCDLSFLDTKGVVLAHMNGVEMHFRGEPKVQPALQPRTAAI